MSKLQLSQALLDTDISSMSVTSGLTDEFSLVAEDLANLIDDTLLTSDASESGNQLIYNNPTYSGNAGDYNLQGKLIIVNDADGFPISSSSNISGAKINTGDGYITANGSQASAQKEDGSYNYTVNLKTLSYKGMDNTEWSISGSLTSTYSYNASTELENISYNTSFTSLSSSDAEGNSLSVTGNIKYDNTNEVLTGYFTAASLSIGDTKLTATGLKISFDDFINANVFSGALTDVLPLFLTGNDTVTVSSDDTPTDEIHGYTGNDKITGSDNDDQLFGDEGKDTLLGGQGKDLIVGGSGSDKLTGGLGADIFAFKTSDFISEKTNGDLVFNKSIDKINDFKADQGDVLDLTDLGQLETGYTELSEAKKDHAELFYIDGKIYYDIGGQMGQDYKPVVIITLTGNPILDTAQILQ